MGIYTHYSDIFPLKNKTFTVPFCSIRDRNGVSFFYAYCTCVVEKGIKGLLFSQAKVSALHVYTYMIAVMSCSYMYMKFISFIISIFFIVRKFRVSWDGFWENGCPLFTANSAYLICPHRERAHAYNSNKYTAVRFCLAHCWCLPGHRGYLVTTEAGRARLKEGGMEGAYLGDDGRVHIPGKRVTLYSDPSPPRPDKLVCTNHVTN